MALTLDVDGCFDDRSARRGRRQFHAYAHAAAAVAAGRFPEDAVLTVVCTLKDGRVILCGRGRLDGGRFVVSQGHRNTGGRKRLGPLEVDIALKVKGQPVPFFLNERPSAQMRHRVLLVSRRQKGRMVRALREGALDDGVLRQLDTPHVELNGLRARWHALLDQELQGLHRQEAEMESVMDAREERDDSASVSQVAVPPAPPGPPAPPALPALPALPGPVVAEGEQDTLLLDQSNSLCDVTTDVWERYAEAIVEHTGQQVLAPQTRARVLGGVQDELVARAVDANGNYSQEGLEAAFWDLVGQSLEDLLARYAEPEEP